MSDVNKDDSTPQLQQSSKDENSMNQSPVEHPPAAEPTSQSSPQSQAADRAELLARARTFLASPQVQHQDIAAKRAFLTDKGLQESEIDELLRSQPRSPPAIPPRAYPQPPPSSLPVLLLGLARLFSWLAGGAAILTLIYHRILLPRIAQTSLARHTLRSHHLALLRRLTTSLSSLKEQQSESFSVLPRPDPFKESKPFSACTSLSEALKLLQENSEEVDITQLPAVTVLRCGLNDLSKERSGEYPTTEDLFRYLESQLPWLLSEDGLSYENQLWDTLSTCQSFQKVTPEGAPSGSADATAISHWKYVPPLTSEPSILVKSMEDLSSALPRDMKSRKSPFQHTLQSLSDFTGYISTQVYLPFRPSSIGRGLTSTNGQSTAEEELRKEIRALKGLVLNRRSFMPSVARATLSSSATSVS
ncbi:hypothetical protein CVT26_007068 [Gymnopilus dilepis]|uniref:Peroxisomal membrane protein PEX14 n=1 Tax=Gymnopilus dilepis TaxID=231916 RepID=A0A409VNG3_9AGAR|nr:hypothetical protein CVT26_007068 [Gymnopilus dilepis]